MAISDEFPHVLRKTKRHAIIFRAVACSIYFTISLPMVTQVSHVNDWNPYIYIYIYIYI